MSERPPVQHDPEVLEGEDELPRMPETTSDPYVPHLRDRQSWASRGRILLWAWIPVVVIVAAVVWAHYR
ncbi:MAG TPA: hypothetical protein VFL66_13495 [Gaiellaceae bacterium]|nr:hypothetical protein [Gaiellaceae bacterium]